MSASPNAPGGGDPAALVGPPAHPLPSFGECPDPAVLAAESVWDRRTTRTGRLLHVVAKSALQHSRWFAAVQLLLGLVCIG